MIDCSDIKMTSKAWNDKCCKSFEGYQVPSFETSTKNPCFYFWSHITLLKTNKKPWQIRVGDLWDLDKMLIFTSQVFQVLPRFPMYPSHIRMPHLYMCHPKWRIFPHCQDSSNRHLRSTWSTVVEVHWEQRGLYILINTNQCKNINPVGTLLMRHLVAKLLEKDDSNSY